MYFAQVDDHMHKLPLFLTPEKLSLKASGQLTFNLSSSLGGSKSFTPSWGVQSNQKNK